MHQFEATLLPLIIVLWRPERGFLTVGLTLTPTRTPHTRERREGPNRGPTILVSLVTGDIQYYYRSDSAEYYTVYIDW